VAAAIAAWARSETSRCAPRGSLAAQLDELRAALGVQHQAVVDKRLVAGDRHMILAAAVHDSGSSTSLGFRELLDSAINQFCASG
jgi:hypothetical protein